MNLSVKPAKAVQLIATNSNAFLMPAAYLSIARKTLDSAYCTRSIQLSYTIIIGQIEHEIAADQIACRVVLDTRPYIIRIM